ncbi:major facilitator superfamily domain-containing protein [Fomitopsis serialis]|uniref:major facilitator superfamily domain-containing protein n=1 Tax=Fomitopsis serialis TaxID=139415 RepID=UPI0020082534|nr:major facilitator superfamily domain-containing protein [Neoantrodia serialis]KAH9937277.1 major facilitator superfamily domain-containing protein [Neoantrodia serialis]
MAADERTPLLTDAREEVSTNGHAQNGVDEAASGARDEDAPKLRVSMPAVMGSLMLGIFLMAMDGTIVASTYASIGSEFHRLENTSWIATGYMLTLTSFQPLYGKLSDIFGRKACLMSAMSIFAVGSLLCGLAPDMKSLVIARAIAGIGGGGQRILMSDIVSLRNRGTLQGIGNVVFASGQAAGAPLGGLFADTIGWRWAFIIQVPIAFLALLSIAFGLKLPPKEDQEDLKLKLKRIDFAGAFTLVHLHANFFMTGANMTMLFTVPLYLQAVQQFTPSQVGLTLLSNVIAGAVGSVLAGLIMKSTGKYYLLTLLVYFLSFVGNVIIAGVTGPVAFTLAGLCAGSILNSVYLGGSLTTTLVAMIANAGQENQAVATAVSYLFRSLGGVVVLSISMTLTQETLRTHLRARLTGADVEEIIKRVRESLSYIDELRPEVRALVRSSYQDGVQKTLWRRLCPDKQKQGTIDSDCCTLLTVQLRPHC